jgi:predicted ester cyclase
VKKQSLKTKGEYQMSLKELKDKIIRWEEEAWLKGNVNAMDEGFAPDVVLHMFPFPAIKGLEAVKQGILAQLQAYSNIQWDTEEMICEGNTIVFRYTLRMKHTGASLTMPVSPTGKELVLKGCDVFHMKDGKIVEMFGYRDYLGMLQQLGIAPLMGKK